MNPQRKAADARLKREYGISLLQYETIFINQGRVCAICKKPVPVGRPRLAVDHDHKSGLIRGLLCNWCNRAIARFRDNVILLQNAVEYLTNPPATLALGREVMTAPGRVGSKKRRKLLQQLKLKSQ